MKIFISQPMYGKTEEQIKQERQDLIKQIEENGDTYINSVFEGEDGLEEMTNDSIGIFYLGKSLEVMSEADQVWFMPGWGKSRGCKIEHLVAKEYKKKIIEL